MATKSGKVAKRYARALFELCQPQDFEPRRNALLHLAKDLEQNRELREALKNPAIPPAQRESVVRDLVQQAKPGDAILANFLATLLSNDRLSALNATIRIFSDMIEQFMRLLALEITSAQSLSDDQRRALQSDIQKRVPQEYASMVSVEWKENRDLIGGMVIKAGDKVLDGSLAGSLDRVTRNLQ